jgi:hypothetical protein
MANGISVYDLIPAESAPTSKPKKAGGLKVSEINKVEKPPVAPAAPRPLQKFASQAVSVAKTAAKSFIDDPEATTLAGGVALFDGAVSMFNTAASGVAALAKTMVKAPPGQNIDVTLQDFTTSQKKIQATLEGVNRAPTFPAQEHAMQDLLNLIPEGTQVIGDSVFEKTGNALAATGALSLATVLTLSPDVAAKTLGKVREVAKGGEPPSRVSAAFDEMAAKHPEAATKVAEHVEQVDPMTARYMKRKIQKFLDASDKELSIIGKNAAEAAIADLEGDFDKIRPQPETGVSTGEGVASKTRGRKSGAAEPLISPVKRDALGTPLDRSTETAKPVKTAKPAEAVDVEIELPKGPSKPAAQGAAAAVKSFLTGDQVASTIRTAAKEGTEAIAKQPEPERTNMALSKEERALERERVAARRAREEGFEREHEPEPVPRRAAEHEGEVARRRAEDEHVEPKSDHYLYISSGIPVSRGMVEGAFDFAISTAEKVPGFKIARSKMESLYNIYIETFNPEAKGAPARTAGAAIARNFFDQAHKEHVTWEEGKQRRVYWQKMGTKASLDFIKAMETGTKLSNPTQEKARLGYKAWNEAIVAQDVRTYAGSGKDLPYEPRENYLAHAFVDNDGFIRWASKKYGNKWADPKFIKDRTFNLYQEAIDAGFTPKSTNPEEIMQMRQFQSDIAALRTDLLADLERKGVAQKAAKGADRPPEGFSPNSRRSPTGVRYWVKEEADALMHNAFDSASLWNLQGSALKRGVSSGFRGWMGAKNALIPIKLGLSLFHPMHVLHIDASATLARETKGLLGDPGLNSIRSFMNNAATAYLQPLWTNPKIGYPVLKVFQGKRDFASLSDGDKAAFRDLAEGGMVPTRPKEETSGHIQKFKDAVNKKSVIAVWHMPWAALAATSHPLFGVWIPTLKIASYLKDVKVARELNPDWTDSQRQEAFRQIARKVEARYGEMNYNSLFMDKMLKDIGVATNLSLGWNIGLLDQYVGGAIDLGKATKRIGLDVLDPNSKGSEIKRQLAAGTLDRPVFATYYVASALAIGGMMQYFFTGKPPEKLIDYTHPKSGEKDQYGKDIRLNTMFYTREFEGLYKHMQDEGVVPGLSEFVKNKGSGLMEMSRTALTGVDSLGNDIRNPEDPAYKQFEQTLYNTLSGLDPISVEAINKSNGPASVKTKALDVMGFTPAGKYISETVTEGKIADRFNRYVRPKEKPFEGIQMAKDINNLKKLFAKDDPKYDDKLEEAVKKYDMTDKDVHRIEKLFNSPKEQEFDPSVYMFQKLPWEVQKPLLDQMPSEEREKYLEHVSKAKRAKYERETEAEGAGA